MTRRTRNHPQQQEKDGEADELNPARDLNLRGPGGRPGHATHRTSRVVPLRPPPWDWDFEVEGSLAVQPRRVPLQDEAAFGYGAADATRLRARACDAAAGGSSRCAPEEAIGGAYPARVGRSRHVAPDRFRVGSLDRGPDRRAGSRDTAPPCGAAAPAGGRAPGDAPAPAAGRAEPRDGDRLPRLRRRRAHPRPGRPAGEPGARHPGRAEHLRRKHDRPALLRARRRGWPGDRLPRRRRRTGDRRLLAGGRDDRRDHALRPVGQALRRAASTSSRAATRRSSSRSPTCAPTRA